MINIGLGIFLVSNIFRHQLTPSAWSLIALVLGGFLWSFGYSMEMISPSFGAKLFWAKFEYFGITSVPLAWFSFAFRNLRSPGWPDRPWKQRIAFGVLPGLTLALVWTNGFHGLIWENAQLQKIGSALILVINHGPLFWIYLAYAYCLMFAGSFMLARGLTISYQISRWRTGLRLAAILVPWLGNFIYVTGLNPIPPLDWSPLAITISALLFAISLYRSPLIDLLPIAQKTIFTMLPDWLLVLDAQNNLMGMNAAAGKMVGVPETSWHGKSLADVFPEMADWVSQASFQEEFRGEVCLEDEPDEHCYDLRMIPLASSNMRPVGRLVVCHEITQHKRVQAQLEKIRAQLEETVKERTAELRRTVDQLQVELHERTMAERRFEDVIESAPDAMLLLDRSGTIRLVNAQAEKMFGYARNELLDQSYERLITADLREHLHKDVVQFFSDPSLRQKSLSRPLSGQGLIALRQDGSTFPVEISLGTLNTSEGIWIACDVRDITERRKAEEEQKRLLEEIEQSREELRALAIRLSEAREYEQRQIAVELHDRVGQNLTGLNLNLQVIQNLIPTDGFSPVLRRLADSMDLVEETTRQVRSVMADLNPPLLEDYGLGAALRFSCETFMNRTGIETRFSGDDFHPRLSQREEMALFRIVQEALNNAVKHAQATRVEIRIETSDRLDQLTVEDNGQGFNAQDIHKAGGQPHWGLLSIQERAASIGGELQIHSAPGQGTSLKVVIIKREPDD